MVNIEDLTNKIINADCLDILKELPDKSVDLILTDPPYGIGFGTFNRTNKLKNGQRVKADKYKNSDWDSETPCKEIFDEIFRVSKNQIIWGGQLFSRTLEKWLSRIHILEKEQSLPEFWRGRISIYFVRYELQMLRL